MEEWIIRIRDWVWGFPLLLLFFTTGAYLTLALRGVQFTYTAYGIREAFAKKRAGSEGDISHFEALMTTLAGAIGTGSIVGVSTGLVIGGPGSLFWMWITAVFCMATKFAESLLAVKYRQKDANGEMIGGPMEYMADGLGQPKVAMMFAILGSLAAFGIGNLVQVNSISDVVEHIFSVNPWITGVILMFLTGLVILGGIKSIGRVASILVPLMALFYLLFGSFILIYYIDRIPYAFSLIISSAFSGKAALGGAAGGGLMLAIQNGVSRGIFSSEAGLGVPSIAAAAADTDSPVRQALIIMTGTLFSTVVICTMTGLVLIVTGVLDGPANLHMAKGSALAVKAFSTVLPGGNLIVGIGLILFAFSSVIAWAYYGEKCCEYVFGEKSVLFYRIFFTLLVLPGAVIDLTLAWGLADIANGLLAIPNLIALIALTPVMQKEIRKFFSQNGGLAL